MSEQYEGRRPDDFDEDDERLEDDGQTTAAIEAATAEAKQYADVRETLVGLVPASAFHDDDLTGETWSWTTPRGTFKLMRATLPQPSVALEFRQPQQRQDRVQFVIVVKNPTVEDVMSFLAPVLADVLTS